jgi:hypothetical protein
MRSKNLSVIIRHLSSWVAHKSAGAHIGIIRVMAYTTYRSYMPASRFVSNPGYPFCNPDTASKIPLIIE